MWRYNNVNVKIQQVLIVEEGELLENEFIEISEIV